MFIPQFKTLPSKKDYRTVTSDDLAQASSPPPISSRVDLNKPCTNELCSQGHDGVCTGCGTRMADEVHFNDGVRLSEWWKYLMGKTLIDGNLTEGSSVLTMLKSDNKYGVPTADFCQAYPLNTTGTYEDLITSFQTQYGGVVPQAILDNAALHKIGGYYSVALNPTAIATEISAGRLVIFRLVVGDNTYTDSTGAISWFYSAICPWRPPVNNLGGHCIAMSGYENLSPTMKMILPQSWGTGYCPDSPYGAGYVSILWSSYAPYITEGWAIDALPQTPTIVNKINGIPVPTDVMPPWMQSWYASMIKLGIGWKQGGFFSTK